MRTVSIGAVFVACFILFGCATATPMRREKALLPLDDPSLKNYGIAIDTSPLSSANRAIAKQRIHDLAEATNTLNLYAADLHKVMKDNEELDGRYSWVNGIIGAVGSASGLGVLLGSAYAIVPGIGVAWEVFGLTTQKLNVVPEIERGQKQSDATTAMSRRTQEASDDFAAMVQPAGPMSDGSTCDAANPGCPAGSFCKACVCIETPETAEARANAAFIRWDQKVRVLTTDISTFLGYGANLAPKRCDIP
jgi:hypothetical protein